MSFRKASLLMVALVLYGDPPSAGVGGSHTAYEHMCIRAKICVGKYHCIRNGSNTFAFRAKNDFARVFSIVCIFCRLKKLKWGSANRVSFLHRQKQQKPQKHKVLSIYLAKTFIFIK